MRKTVDLQALQTCREKTLIAISMSSQNVVRTVNDMIMDRVKLQQIANFQPPTGDDVTPQQIDALLGANANTVNGLRFRWGAYNEYLLTLEDAVNGWREWNQSIQDTFTTGMASQVNSSGGTQAVPFIEDKPGSGIQTHFSGVESEEGTVYSTKANTILEYFYQVKAYNSYGHVKAHTAKELDRSKNYQAGRAIRELNDIISDAAVNAHMAAQVFDELVTKRSSVAGFLDEINNVALRIAAQGTYG